MTPATVRSRSARTGVLVALAAALPGLLGAQAAGRSMKVCISVDLEGIAGVVSDAQTSWHAVLPDSTVADIRKSLEHPDRLGYFAATAARRPALVEKPHTWN